MSRTINGAEEPIATSAFSGVGVLVGGRFPIGPLCGRDVQVLFVGVVPCLLHDGLALGFPMIQFLRWTPAAWRDSSPT